VVFIGFVIACLVIDACTQRSKQDMRPRRALVLSGLWILAGVLVGVAIAARWGSAAGTEYIAGFTIEKMLSVDNLAVISALFTMHQIPTRLQKRVLTYGIIGAIVFRAVFVLAGASVLHRFEIIGAFFALVLLWTAWKMIAGSDHDGPAESRTTRYLERKNLLHAGFDGDRFTTLHNGRRVLTTLGLAVVLVELTDLVFAVDSVPAVLAVSPDPFIAFTSNVMAVLGLRALYFLLATGVEKFRYLNQTLAAVLAFVGVKMLIASLSTPLLGEHHSIPVGLSLGIVAVCFTTGLTLSVVANRRQIL
jgi:tellurite resistance protein TerC